MTGTLIVADLFAAAKLSPTGHVRWGEPCGETQQGVYVVTVNEEIVYVGCTKHSLSRRIGQFYRHKYGDKSPHRGGQEILAMPGERLVYWCPTDEPRKAEEKMLAAFDNRVGCLPPGNKRRGDRSRSSEPQVADG